MFNVVNLYKRFLVGISKFNHKFYSSTIIKSVEIDYSGYVYNLSIEDDETYIADGFVVHNCRSTTIPAVKEEFTVAAGLTGKRGSKGADGAKPISAKSTYGGWLKKQPKEFVDEALGPERSKLFRSGELSIEKFTDPTGRVFTLQQLADQNPLVFQEF